MVENTDTWTRSHRHASDLDTGLQVIRTDWVIDSRRDRETYLDSVVFLRIPLPVPPRRDYSFITPFSASPHTVRFFWPLLAHWRTCCLTVDTTVPTQITGTAVVDFHAAAATALKRSIDISIHLPQAQTLAVAAAAALYLVASAARCLLSLECRRKALLTLSLSLYCYPCNSCCCCFWLSLPSCRVPFTFTQFVNSVAIYAV